MSIGHGTYRTSSMGESAWGSSQACPRSQRCRSTVAGLARELRVLQFMNSTQSASESNGEAREAMRARTLSVRNLTSEEMVTFGFADEWTPTDDVMRLGRIPHRVRLCATNAYEMIRESASTSRDEK